MITELAAGELDRLHGLRVELHRHHVELGSPTGHSPRDEEEAWRSWRAQAAEQLAADRAVVLVESGGPAGATGFAYVRLMTDDELARTVLHPDGGHAELVTLVVADGARSGGVGAALMSAAADWARGRGAGTMHIAVRAANADALRFYRRHGASEAFTTMLLPL